MINKLNSLKKLISNTPLIKITYGYKGLVRSAYFKLEWYSVTGSIKDRAALYILEQMINSGLKSGDTICEVTSGNMGLSLCALANFLNVKTKIFLPKFMSKERISLLKLYGAELVLTEDFKHAFELCKKEENCFFASQFENSANTLAHYQTTAKEIYSLISNPSAFISGVGTSGTLTGCGKFFKEQDNTIKVIAVDPDSSKLLTTGASQGSHQIQGLSDEIIPKLYDKNLIDDIINVTDIDAIAMAQKICRTFGLGIGISSGANFIASVLSNLNNTVSVFPDDNKKYLSTNLSQNVHSDLVDEIELLSMERVTEKDWVWKF